MKNNTNPPFAKAQPTVKLSELIPGTRRPKSQLEKFGDLLTYLADGKKIVQIKLHKNAIELITEEKE